MCIPKFLPYNKVWIYTNNNNEYIRQTVFCIFIERIKKSKITYISVMVSGRFVGISVRPFPRQSTMLLLQVHAAGQCKTLQDGAINDWWPAKGKTSF